MGAESKLSNEVFAKFGASPGITIFRNNIGLADFGSHKVAYGVGGAGAPDLLVLVETVVGTLPLWVETKAPRGRIRPSQAKWHNAAKLNCWHAVFCYSVDDFGAAVKAVRDAAIERLALDGGL